MTCQSCLKRRATVHLTEIGNSGEKQERHLCEACASEQGVVHKASVSVNEVLAKFMLAHSGARGRADMTCPECGITFAEFHNNGLLGCPHDYDAFAKPLTHLLERAHGGGARHVGKVPHHAAEQLQKQHHVARLRRELDEAVKAEKYEEAAKLRDEINELEKA
jgi:protein arginine kinase activator